jgi:S1-C subfamily serine protease
MRPFVLLLAIVFAAASGPVARAAPSDGLGSVVSVLPVWPGRAQGGAGAPPGTAPEGSGIVVAPGIVATAWHVIEPARRIDVRLHDGRVLPARLIAADAASDIAVLDVETDLPSFEIAPEPGLAEPACAIGNAFGLGLSVTCGVVSATAVTNAGFNAVEDFVQTDAATNPGMSGGALVDADGRLVGMLSAIFASDADTNIGVNFAVSSALLIRVVDALLADGKVTYPAPGWRLGVLDGADRARIAAARILGLLPDGPAARAGLREGDLILRVGERRTRTPRDVVAALALVPEDTGAVDVVIERDGVERPVALNITLAAEFPAETSAAPMSEADCPFPPPVCAVRRAVFPISSFDPVGSATRIGETLLVTNRHVVADRLDAVVHTPDGPRNAVVAPSAYPGDLVLLEVTGLPEGGYIPLLDRDEIEPDQTFHAIGADVARRQIRVFDPGEVIAGPATDAPLGRLHVTAWMQPGVSGGALVDAEGDLVAIAVGGGDGRFEAIPVSNLRTLLALRDSPDALRIHEALGRAFVACDQAMRGDGEAAPGDLIEACEAADNHGQLLEAGRVLGRTGDIDGAIAMHARAVAQVPNSINARISLLVSLQIGGRFEEMIPHAAWLMGIASDDPRALRFAVQSGVWGGAPDMAETAYGLLLEADPRQAEAARRFIDNAPPAPPRR